VSAGDHEGGSEGGGFDLIMRSHAVVTISLHDSVRYHAFLELRRRAGINAEFF
jgi:hypothetical protein